MPLFGNKRKVKFHKLYLTNGVIAFTSALSSTEVLSFNAQAGTVDAVSAAIKAKAKNRKILEKAFDERPLS
jgi:hypothetical protein